MNGLGENLFNMVSEKTTDFICKTAIKVTESSCNKCLFFGVYESTFPMELEEEIK